MNLLWILIVLCVAGPIAGAVAYRLMHGSEAGRGPTEDVPSGEKVRELRSEVRELAGEVERLAEQQRFLEELLEERPTLGSGDQERTGTA